MCWNLIPRVMVFWSRTTGRRRGQEGKALMNGVCVLTKMIPESPESLWGCRGKAAVYGPGSKPSLGTESFCVLTLDLLTARTLRKRFLLFIIYIIFVCNIQIIHRAQFALAEVGSSPCPPLFLPVRPPFSLPPAFEATLSLISISIIPLALLGSSLPVTSHSVLEHLYTWVSPTQEAAFYLFMTFHNFDDSQHNFFFFTLGQFCA